jgi:hypothetical protein
MDLVANDKRFVSDMLRRTSGVSGWLIGGAQAGHELVSARPRVRASSRYVVRVACKPTAVAASSIRKAALTNKMLVKKTSRAGSLLDPGDIV